MGRTGHRPNTDLVRVLGVSFGLAASVGGMVGQGILRTPGIVAGAVPDPTIIVLLWLGIGLFCLLDACGTVEIATAVPCAGGPYAFVDRAFGRTAAATIGWADTINAMVAIGFLAVVSAEYLQRLGLMAGQPTGRLAAIVVATFTAVNWTGTRICGASQSVGSFAKGVGLIVLIGLLFGSTAQASPAPVVSRGLSIVAFAVAARAVKNTYDGWNLATYFCEEVQAPERNLPRSVFGSILLVTALYTVVNIALLHALTPVQIAASNLPAADAMQARLGGRADLLVSMLAALSVLAITNLYLMSGSRVTFAMARRGVLPAPLTQVSMTGTPRVALLALATPGALLAWSGNYAALVAYSVALLILINSAVSLAALRLRRTEPDLPRPFRTPLYPLPILASLAINAALMAAMIYEDAPHSLSGITIVLAIGCAYWVAGAAQRRRAAARPV